MCSGVKDSLKAVEGVFQCEVSVKGRAVEDVAESMNNGAERVWGI